MTAQPDAISLDQLLELDSTRTLVLTVNNRHARRLLADISSRLDAERSVIAPPDILPFSAWLQRVADTLSFRPDAGLAAHVLDGYGALCLWRRVIGELEADHVLLDLAQAARLAMDADRLMSEWQLSVPEALETDEYRRFRLWRRAYRQRLQALDAEDAVLTFEQVCAVLARDGLPEDHSTVVLAGFSELSPRFQALLRALNAQGVQLYALGPDPVPTPQVRHVQAPDPDAEWRLAAQWAARQLRGNPQGRYAIVAPNLQACVAQAHRMLHDALREQPQHGQPALPFNIALARSLADWPAAQAALHWLRLVASLGQEGRCEPGLAGAALLAGHCAGGDAEAGARAVLDAAWRRRGVLAVSARAFQQALRATPVLARAWQGCLQALDGATAPAQADIWAQRFRVWLECLGFPGEAPLDSHAHQTVQALERVLATLARQAVVLGELDLHQAMAALDELAHVTPFQPERDPTARLDVQGLLETQGGRWDGIWILGLTDETLPAVPSPNPLVPLKVQRDAGAPRATPARELHWARELFQDLLRCAPLIVLSHAAHEGERELRASPCLQPWLAEPCVPDVDATQAAELERVLDERGPPLAEGSDTRGGIAVLDVQARNPLWAFARYRLGASALPGYASLADQNVRGMFLHHCMEEIYRELQGHGQEELRRQRADGRLQALAERALQQAAQACLEDYGAARRELELDRARDILQAWFEHELARGPFRVLAVEQARDWTYGPLRLGVRLDRVDELQDGSLAVIDYKTGGGRLDPRSDWTRLRPVALQLPFYAAVLADQSAIPAALALARLHARKVEFKGLAGHDCGMPGLAAPADWAGWEGVGWEEVLQRWRQAIELLAREYADGVARNDSLREDDLAYCDVLPFLRRAQEADHDEA